MRWRVDLQGDSKVAILRLSRLSNLQVLIKLTDIVHVFAPILDWCLDC